MSSFQDSEVWFHAFQLLTSVRKIPCVKQEYMKFIYEEHGMRLAGEEREFKGWLSFTDAGVTKPVGEDTFSQFKKLSLLKLHC